MRRIAMACGGLISVALVMAGLWGWQHAGEVAGSRGGDRADLVLWAMRCGAAGALAGAQVVALTLVVGKVYRRGLLDEVLRVSAAVVFLLALVGAIALGLAGR